MATEAARLKGKNPWEEKKNQLDSHRPSHGRTWLSFVRRHKPSGVS
jgi:hypothetical protein